MASALRKVQADRVDTETGAVCVAQPGDLLAVLRVLAQGDPSGALPASASHAERGTWAHMMRTEGMMVYVAEVDGRVVGTATLLVMPNLTYQCAPTVFIGAVVVATSHRRHGIASAMIRRILTDTRSSGCNKVQLLWHKRHASDGADGLYTALGFEPEAQGFRLCHQQVSGAVRSARAT